MARFPGRGSVVGAPTPGGRLPVLGILAGTILALWVASAVFIPLAFAVLLSFLFSPLVTRLERYHIPRVPAVLLVTLIACTPVAAVGSLVVSQLVEVVANAQQWQLNIEAKLAALEQSTGGLLSRVIHGLRGPEASGAPGSAMELLGRFIGPVLHPLATVGLVVVFTVFILIQREDLRDRLIRLISRGELTVTTQALDELALRVARYLRMELIINTCYGAIIAAVLSWLGLPGAILWGVLVGALRFIPYAGIVVGAGMPLLLSVAVFNTWQPTIVILLLFVSMEIVVANFLEPWLWGASAGVSITALLVAAVFWTWLWGLPGLLLSTPLTVCLAVAGRYVPQLAFLDVLLGDVPVLSPSEQVYQRLLAMNQEEAEDVAETYLQDHPLADLYEQVLIPVLRRGAEDRQRGLLDDERAQFLDQAMREIVEETADYASRQAQSRAAAAAATGAVATGPLAVVERVSAAVIEAVAGPAAPPTGPSTSAPAAPPPQPVPATADGPPAGAGPRALCIPARDEADAIAALMLAELLLRAGFTPRALSRDDLGADLEVITSDFKPDVLCISAVPPHASIHARLRCRLLRRKLPGAKVLVGLWGLAPDPATVAARRIADAGADAITGSLVEAPHLARGLVQATPTAINSDASGALPITGPPAPPDPARAPGRDAAPGNAPTSVTPSLPPPPRGGTSPPGSWSSPPSATAPGSPRTPRGSPP